jgi:L-asparaginase II
MTHHSEAGGRWKAQVARSGPDAASDAKPRSESAILAEITRSDVVESVHRGRVAVVARNGSLLASAGDPSEAAYFRSSAKPFQAVPLVESGAADAFGFGTRELALACSSHDSTPDHQRGVTRMLEMCGLREADLRCGISPIADEQEQARSVLGLVWPSQVQCECSGEHAGMLAATKHLGYELDDYVAREHPLQRRILEIVATVLGMREDDIAIGTDGCSIPTFAAPLQRFAWAYAVLAAPHGDPPIPASLATALDRLRDAMLAHPVLVGNDGVLDTDIMQFSGGKVVAKLGAEGLLCLAVPERGLGIAISTEDGMPRGLGPAAIATLQQLGLADDTMIAALRERHAGPVPSFKGKPVGEIRPRLTLEFT